MTSKRIFTAACCALVLGLLTLSCAPAAGPTPTPKPAAPPPAQPSPPAKPAAASSPAPASPTVAPKPAQQPRYGGALAIANQGDPPSFDLHTEISILVHGTFGAVYSGLIQSDPKDPSKVAPDLAESWEVSTDGTVHTFRLRKDVRFHDGKPFTAADARASLERLTAKSPRVSATFQQVIVKVEDPDPNTVRLTLKYPYPPIFKYLALNFVAMMPKHVIDAKGDMKRDAVGTGAFKFVRHNVGTSLEFVKNEDYFVKGRPYLDKLTFYPMKDAFTRLAAFRTNRVKMIYPLAFSTEDAKVVQREVPGASAEQFEGANWWLFYMNVDKKPWDDVRVRRAVHLAIDRQRAMEVVDPDAARPYGIVPPQLGGTPESELLKMPGWRQPKDQDRAEAKRLLAEAGYPNGFKTSMLTRIGRVYEGFSTFMVDQLKTIGITADIDIKEDASFFDAELKRTFHSHPYRNPLDVQDADTILPTYYKTGSPKNFSGFSDKEIDDLITRQSQMMDPEQRKQVIQQIEMKLFELAPATVSHWGAYWICWMGDVKGFVRPAGIYDDMKHVETWLSP